MEPSSSTSQSFSQPPAYPPTQKKSRWWIPLAIIGAIVAGLFVLIIGFFFTLGSALEGEQYTVSSGSVLYLSAPGAIQEYKESNPFSIFSSTNNRPLGFLDILNSIRNAKYDDNIAGIYYRAGRLRAGFAKATELRDALLDFKESGKFIYAFIEFGNENDYYFASVADSIFMPREGIVEMNGFAISSMFFKDMFDNIGVDVHIQQYEEYKSAGESYGRTSFSEAAREQYGSILQQRLDVFVDATAHSRAMEREHIFDALNRGVYTSDTMLTLGFIDAIASETSIRERLRSRVGLSEDDEERPFGDNDLKLVSLTKYRNSSSYTPQGELAPRDKQIAIVYGVGPIVSGSGSQSDPLNEEQVIASQTFTKNLRKAVKNENVQAIIVRIDSPGGSAIASEAIVEEIEKASEEKPVYASMSDVAASGGYFMAVGCDTIVAHRQTVTGSIGVILTLFGIHGTLDRLGISVDTVSASQSATFLNTTLPISEADRQRLATISKGIYDRFLERVANARGQTAEQIRNVAKGRVWTGADAMELGLVDKLGGLGDAIDIAKARLGVPEDQLIRIKMYPEPVEPITAFSNLIEGLDEDEDDAISLSSFIEKRMASSGSAQLIWDTLPEQARLQLSYFLRLNSIAAKERTLLALPSLPIIE